MAIAFVCEKCGKKLKASDDAGGTQHKCPHCQEMVQIPELPIERQVLKRLDHIGGTLLAIHSRLGWVLVCLVLIGIGSCSGPILVLNR